MFKATRKIKVFEYLIFFREVHSLFLEHFLTTSAKLGSAKAKQFDFCDPFHALNNDNDSSQEKVNYSESDC